MPDAFLNAFFLRELSYLFHLIILGGGYSPPFTDLQFMDEETEAQKVKKLAQDPEASK